MVAGSLKTYLVVEYRVNWTKTGNFTTGPLYLYDSMSFVNAVVSPNKTEGRQPPVTMGERFGVDDPPKSAQFFTSLVIADPEGDKRRAAEAARRFLQEQAARQRAEEEARHTGPRGRREYHTPSGTRIPEY